MSFIHFFGNVANNYNITFNTLLNHHKSSLILHALSDTVNPMPYLYPKFHQCTVKCILSKLQNENLSFDETYYERLLSLINLYLLKGPKYKRIFILLDDMYIHDERLKTLVDVIENDLDCDVIVHKPKKHITKKG